MEGCRNRVGYSAIDCYRGTDQRRNSTLSQGSNVIKSYVNGRRRGYTPVRLQNGGYGFSY